MPGTVSEVSATLVASTIPAPGWGEDPVLLGRRQPGVQRQDLGVRRSRPRGVGRVVDLPLAGQEHQEVAGPEHQLVDRVDDRLRLVPVVVRVVAEGR